MTELKLTYISEVNAEERFLEDITGLCTDLRLEPELKNRLMLVLSELFNNAVIHANRLDRNKKVQVVIRVNKTDISADIIDEGVNGLENIKKRKPSDWYSEGGRGIDLVEHYCDTIEYFPAGKKGLRITVGFKREKQTKINT